VPVGSYVIVQDTIFNGHPVPEGWGPGPYEAVEAFVKENDNFVVDRDRERLMITFNRMGFLKRVK
jgi:cephalosporin hydroxylase